MTSPQKRKRAGAGDAAPPARTPPLAAGLTALWAFAVFFRFYSYIGRTVDVPSWLEFSGVVFSHALLRPDFIAHCLQIVLMWFVFAGLGKPFADRIALAGMTPWERGLISAGLGAGIAASALLAFGLAGLWNPRAMRIVFYSGAAVCAARAVVERRRGSPETAALPRPPAAPEPHRVLIAASVGLIAAAAVMNILATTAPETFYDALVYHLALPKLYLLRGRIGPTPENVYSGMPLGFEMLYGLALALGNENLAALLHCSVGILTTAAVWAFMRRCASRSAAALAALIFYLTPIVLYASWQSGADLGAAFYTILALSVLSTTLQSRETRPAELIAAGCLLGFAMSVKFTVGPMLAMFSLVYVHLRRRIEGAAPLKEAAIMIAAAAAVFCPWPIKSFAFYGNPLYPFLYKWFGRTTPADWKGFLDGAHALDMRETFGTLAGWKRFLVRPWTISMWNRELSDWPGLAYLMVIPWALSQRWGFVKKDDAAPAWTAIGLLSIAGYLVSAASSDLVRYMLVTLPIAACFASLAVARGSIPLWLRRFAWILILSTSVFNMQETFELGMNNLNRRWDQVRGVVDHDAYLEGEHADYHFSSYAAVKFVNEKLPLDAKLLMLGEARGFRFERDFIAPTVYDRNPFWEAARTSESSDVLLQRIKALGVTHILVNAIGLYVYADRPTVLPLEVVDGKVFQDFWNRCLDKVWEDKRKDAQGVVNSWLIVYKLRDKPVDDPRLFPENPPLMIRQAPRPAP